MASSAITVSSDNLISNQEAFDRFGSKLWQKLKHVEAVSPTRKMSAHRPTIVVLELIAAGHSSR
jgi:hypothetical protein